MSIINEKYKNLAPKGESLSDVVVLAQAWKKSHAYIRRHNWYADVLELDSSTVDLEQRLDRWAEELGKSDFKPNELLLVPAPKNARWEFRPTPQLESPNDLLDVDIESLDTEPSFDDWSPAINGLHPLS